MKVLHKIENELFLHPEYDIISKILTPSDPKTPKNVKFMK